jgi:hypothetical protein
MGETYSKIAEHLPDGDDLFAYDTVKEVKVLDRRLGLVFYSVLLLIIYHIVINVFIIKKAYQDIEKTNGWVVMKVLNTAHSDKGWPFDTYDAVTNPGEQGALFLPTRVLITRGQTQDGFCQSPLHTCESDKDCKIGNKDLQKEECNNGMCMRRQWCPAEQENEPVTEEHLIDVLSYEVWFQTNLHYHKFMLDVSTTDELEPNRYPDDLANTYPVHDMLRMANIKPETVQEYGAVLQTNNIFDCDLDDKVCQVRMEVVNVDTTTGFNYIHNHYYEEGGVEKRDTYHYYGIRLVCFATGIGKVASFCNTVLQVSSAIALLACAQAAADVVLQHVVPERRHYIEKKILETEDFGD